LSEREEHTLPDHRSELARNSGAMAASRLIAASASLVAIPLVIRDLGLVRFGLWESIVAIASLSTTITGPGGGTLLWKMSVAWGEQDGPALRRLLRAGAVGTLILTVVLLLIAVLMRPLVIRFLRVTNSEAGIVQTLFVALVALVFLTGINETLGALNSAMQRVRVTSFGQTAGQIIMYTVSVVGLRIGLGLQAMLIGVAAGQMVTALLLMAGVRRGLIGLATDGGGPFRLGRAAGRYFALLTVGAVSAVLRGQTDRLVLAGLASPVWAGYYSMAARMANLLMEFSNLLYVPTIAAAGALMGAGRWGAIRSLFLDTMKAVSTGGAFLGVLLIGLPEPLLLLWIGSPLPEASLILRIIAAGTLVALLTTGPGTAICKGIGRPGIETHYIIVGLILNVVLTVSLSLTIGAIGTVIASSVSWAVSALYFVFLLHRRLNLPRVATRRAAATLAGVIVAALVTGGLARLLPAPASRPGALLALLGIAPVGFGVLLAAGRWSGGIGILDATALANSLWRRMQPPGPRIETV